jgi:hypothetical protein
MQQNMNEKTNEILYERCISMVRIFELHPANSTSMTNRQPHQAAN